MSVDLNRVSVPVTVNDGAQDLAREERRQETREERQTEVAKTEELNRKIAEAPRPSDNKPKPRVDSQHRDPLQNFQKGEQVRTFSRQEVQKSEIRSDAAKAESQVVSKQETAPSDARSQDQKGEGNTNLAKQAFTKARGLLSEFKARLFSSSTVPPKVEVPAKPIPPKVLKGKGGEPMWGRSTAASTPVRKGAPAKQIGEASPEVALPEGVVEGAPQEEKAEKVAIFNYGVKPKNAEGEKKLLEQAKTFFSSVVKPQQPPIQAAAATPAQIRAEKSETIAEITKNPGKKGSAEGKGEKGLQRDFVLGRRRDYSHTAC